MWIEHNGLCFVTSICDPEQQRFFFSLNIWLFIVFAIYLQCKTFPVAKENARKISNLMSWLLAIPPATVFQQLTHVNMILLHTIRIPVEGH